jgi:hypothetical protein
VRTHTCMQRRAAAFLAGTQCESSSQHWCCDTAWRWLLLLLLIVLPLPLLLLLLLLQASLRSVTHR